MTSPNRDPELTTSATRFMKLPTPLKNIILEYIGATEVQALLREIARLKSIKDRAPEILGEKLALLDETLKELDIDNFVNSFINRRIDLLQRLARSTTPPSEIKLDPKQDPYKQYQSALKQFDITNWLFERIVRIKNPPHTTSDMCTVLKCNESDFREIVSMCCDFSYFPEASQKDPLMELSKQRFVDGEPLLIQFIQGGVKLRFDNYGDQNHWFHRLHQIINYQIPLSKITFNILKNFLEREEFIAFINMYDPKQGDPWDSLYHNKKPSPGGLGTLGNPGNPLGGLVKELLSSNRFVDYNEGVEFLVNLISKYSRTEKGNSFNGLTITLNNWAHASNVRVLLAILNTDSLYKFQIEYVQEFAKERGYKSLEQAATKKLAELSAPQKEEKKSTPDATAVSAAFFTPSKKESLADKFKQASASFNTDNIRVVFENAMRDKKEEQAFCDSLKIKFPIDRTIFKSYIGLLTNLKTAIDTIIPHREQHHEHKRYHINNLEALFDCCDKAQQFKKLGFPVTLAIHAMNKRINYLEVREIFLDPTMRSKVLARSIPADAKETLIQALSETKDLAGKKSKALSLTDRDTVIALLKARMIESILPPDSPERLIVFNCYAQLAETKPVLAKEWFAKLPRLFCVNEYDEQAGELNQFIFARQYALAAAKSELKGSKDPKKVTDFLTELDKVPLMATKPSEGLDKVITLVKTFLNDEKSYEALSKAFKSQGINWAQMARPSGPGAAP